MEKYQNYIVQPGETIDTIASRIGVPAINLAYYNGLRSRYLYPGQMLRIPPKSPNGRVHGFSRATVYQPVTAYTVTEPILVNGVDINQGNYVPLNYKPAGAQYPYIYVPIAEFGRVGAKVNWNPSTQVLTVITDYDELTKENQYLSSLVEDISMQGHGNTAGNLLNDGFIAKENDWLFFKKRYGNALYSDLSKEKTDITMPSTVVTEVEPLYINVLNGWVYYRDGSSDGKIYKVRIDGTEKTKITDDSSTGITVVEDWVYYINQSDGAKLYKINVDGTARTKLNDDQSSAINVIGNWIFYQNISDSHKTYRVKVDGTERTKLNDTSAYNILINGYWIYYRNPVDENRIYKMTMNGTTKVKLTDVPTSRFNMSNGWIYYTTVDTPGGGLYKVKVDGTNNTSLNEQFVTAINIFDDWIYYIKIEKMVYRMKTDGTQKQNLY